MKVNKISSSSYIFDENFGDVLSVVLNLLTALCTGLIPVYREVISFIVRRVNGARTLIFASFLESCFSCYSFLEYWKVEIVRFGSILRHSKQSWGSFSTKNEVTRVTSEIISVR